MRSRLGSGARRPHAATLAVMALLVLVAGCSRDAEMAKGPPQFAELMPVAMAPPPPAGPLYGGHLASYSREADAMRGWNNIVRQHASIGTLKRYLVSADTPKGKMLRLIAGDFTTLDEAQRFCTWAKQQRLYCAVMQLGADGMSAMPLPAPARTPRPARAPAAPPPPASPAPPPG